MPYERELTFHKNITSSFLFGPRLTGKTTLLKKIPGTEYIDLLDAELELEYKTHPELFGQRLAALPEHALVIVDEVQKIPSLLNYVQMAIDRRKQRFLLSGSSARKLKRGGANLLGGRALDQHLHPLTVNECGTNFSIEAALRYGTLPMIYGLAMEDRISLLIGHLKSYVSTYLREEIQAEAATRNLGAFHRFLNVAAQSNGQVIEFSNISRECSVPASTVKEYFQILEDTLLGFFLWPYDRSERKKARPKFYFFDDGVLRAIQNRLQDPPTGVEKGILFETWFLNEMRRIRDYTGKSHDFSLWRRREHEVDILVVGGHGPLLAVECKSGRTDISKPLVTAFRSDFPNVPFMVASLTDTTPRRVHDITIKPWSNVLDHYRAL